MQVTQQRTVLTPRQIAQAFIRAWLTLGYGEPPSQESCGVLYAQWMVETGGRACWNFNIGDVKVSQGQIDAGFPWIDLPGTWEMIHGHKVVLPDGDPGRRFRAYSSLDEAMSDHLALLKNKQFHSSWPFVESGDPVGFTHAIKAGPDGKEGTWDDYFTAPVEVYVAGMEAHFAIWMKSPAYDDAIAALTNEDEIPTMPSLPPTPSDPPPPPDAA